MGQACSTPFQKADLLGAGTVAGRTVPLTFAPPQPALCAHDAHGLCVRGRGAGVVNQSLPTGAPPAAEAAPPLRLPGREGPQRPGRLRAEARTRDGLQPAKTPRERGVLVPRVFLPRPPVQPDGSSRCPASY